MDKLFDKLLHLLREEVVLYKSLLLIIEKERETIAKHRVDLLNEICIEKECLILKVRKAEARVIDVLSRIAQVMGVPANRFTLKILSQSVEESYALQFLACRKRLLGLMEHIRTANEKNRQMILHSLGIIKESMSVLKGLLFPDRVYFSTGRFQERGGGGNICNYDV
jgi:hypothetical protein